MALLRPPIALGALAISCFACAPEAPDLGEPIPEPTEALRPADQRGAVPEDARIADYQIDARLDAEAHVIHGKLRLTWTNRTRRTVQQMPFHLYINGFRASDTAWMREARGEFRGDKLDPDAMGYVTLHRVAGRAGADLADVEAGAAGVDLAWRELADPSVMVVDLPAPVEPGGVAELEIDFETKLPKVFARTGYADDFHMAGQWFPKLGVLEEEAGWQAHTFTTWSEFYADFGNYDVTLDVPADMVVGATGIRTSEQTDGDRKRLTYHAEMVHDFAWTADPDFVEHWGEYEGIRIRQLMTKEALVHAEAHMEAQQWTLRSMEARFGPYPWSTITIVHPPPEGSGAYGMEYPTLYTTSPRETPPAGLVEERFSGLFTTVHEFGHQYFQGLFANNEHNQPWMDEGLNTFSNYLAYSDEFGEDPWIVDLVGHQFHFHDFMRITTARAELDPIDQPSSAFPASGPSYFLVSYNKAATVLATLRNLVGHEAFDEAMAEFTARARFRHPTGDMFESTLIEVLGEEVAVVEGEAGVVNLSLRDYFDQALRTTRQVDFEVWEVENRRRLERYGYFRHEHDGESELHKHYPQKIPGQGDGHTPPEGEGDTDGASTKLETDPKKLDAEHSEGRVMLVRTGEFIVPVEFVVEFQDDTVERLVWDGRARYEVFTFDQKKIRRVVIDPDDKLLLEHDRLDNARYAGELEVGNGLTPALRRLGEGASLAVLGGFAP